MKNSSTDAGPDLFSWNRPRGRGKALPASEAELERFIAALGGRRWMTASRLRDAIGFDDKKLRDLRKLAKGRIISGQKGYCLTTEATASEIDHAASWLESQAREMQASAIDIRNFSHSLIS